MKAGLKFKYVESRRIYVLFIALALTSMLFSTTSISLLSFYKAFLAYLGEGDDVLVVYDRNSRTPFTGVIPMYLASVLSNVSGVTALSPEVIAPCVVNGQSIFVRGIIPSEFLKLNKLTLLRGDYVALNDTHSALVGVNAAERLNLKLGDEFTVFSALTNRYVELKVKGIFASSSFLDDEILVPIFVGQWMRGLGYDYVTLLRLRVDKSEASLTDILNVISAKPQQKSEGRPLQYLNLPIYVTYVEAKNVGVKEAIDYMRDYVDRYGFTKEALLAVSISMFIFASSCGLVASDLFITLHRESLDILRSLGLPRRALKMDILLKALPWSVLASLAGTLIALLLLLFAQRHGYLQFVSHAVPIQLDPLIIALNVALTTLLTSIAIFKSKL